MVASNCMKDGTNIRSGRYWHGTQIPTEEVEVGAEGRRHFNGEKLKKYEMVPVFGITKENVEKFAAGCLTTPHAHSRRRGD